MLILSGKKKYFKLSIKLTVIFVALLILTSIAVGYSLYNITHANIMEEYKNREFQSIALVNAELKAEYIEKWLNDGTDDTYNELYERFKLIRKTFGLKSLYVSWPIRDDNGNMTDSIIDIYDIML